MVRCLLLDLSGVLYDGDAVVPGAVEALRTAREAGLMLRFVTNTSQRTRDKLLRHLHDFGFELAQEELFTAVDAARQWLAERRLRPYCLVHEAIRSEFQDFEQRDPNAVLIADAAEGFTYEALNHAFRLCLEGAPLLCVGYNRYFTAAGQLWLDAGAFVRAVEFAADAEAVVVGKPSAEFFRQVLVSAKATAPESLMVGDDVFGDVEGALGVGMHACLVRTGKYRAGDENKISGAFHLVDSVVDAVQLALAE